MLLQWHLTDRCNLRCAHCYQASRGFRGLSFDELLRILGEYRALLWALSRRAGREVPGHLNLTGGEPFLRPDFLDLLAAVRDARISFGILSNGTLLDLALAQKLRRLKTRFVQVSVEGSEATHDRIRGRGNHRRVVAAIELLVRARVPVLVSFTAHRGNFREFPLVARMAQDLGVTRVWADRLIPEGTGESLRDQVLTPDETHELLLLMREARDEARRRHSRTEVAMHRALQLLAGGRPYRCTAGEGLLTIGPRGELYPCRRLPVPVGDVLEKPLLDLYDRSELLIALRERNRSAPQEPAHPCRRCPHEPSCRGGLRCLSHAVTGDPFQPDPGCWLAPTLC